MITEDVRHCFYSPPFLPPSIRPCCFTHLNLRSLLANQSPRSPPTCNHSSSNNLLLHNPDGPFLPTSSRPLLSVPPLPRSCIVTPPRSPWRYLLSKRLCRWRQAATALIPSASSKGVWRCKTGSSVSPRPLPKNTQKNYSLHLDPDDVLTLKIKN